MDAGPPKLSREWGKFKQLCDVKESISQPKYPEADRSTAHFYQTFSKETPPLLKVLHITETEECYKAFCKASFALMPKPEGHTSRKLRINLRAEDKVKDSQDLQTEFKNKSKRPFITIILASS